MSTLKTLFAIAWKLAALIAAYNVFLFLARPEVHLDFDAGTENRIIAERYVYGPAPEVAMVGSSLGRTVTSFLPANFYNLSFSGGTSITGAEIVLRGVQRPKVVIVETNVMERLLNDEMVNQIFAEPLYGYRRLLPGFRIEYRPALLLVNTEKLHPNLSASAFQSVAPDPMPVARAAQIDIGAEPPVAPEEDDSRLAGGLDVQMKYNAQFSDEQRAKIAKAIGQLTERVDALRARGTCVLLVRLPIQPAVDASPLERYQAEAVRAALPPERYTWIDIKNDGTFHSVDGLHMTNPSAQRVAWTMSNRALRILRGEDKCEPTR